MTEDVKQKARVQATLEELEKNFGKASPEGSTFNIWYQKWSGGESSSHGSQRAQRSPFKCSVSRDSGYTRASPRAAPILCLYFARGCCSKGSNCKFLHRLPTPSDLISPAVDCFGREKFANYREDMGGIGTFLSENKTLFVGYFENTKDILKLVKGHFSEFGEVTEVNLGKDGRFAFITFACEANAQFAREAMSNQTLTGKETLKVRWAARSESSIAESTSSKDADAIKTVLTALSLAQPSKFRDQTVSPSGSAPAGENTLPPLIGKRTKTRVALKRKLVDYSDEEGSSDHEG